MLSTRDKTTIAVIPAPDAGRTIGHGLGPPRTPCPCAAVASCARHGPAGRAPQAMLLAHPFACSPVHPPAHTPPAPCGRKARRPSPAPPLPARRSPLRVLPRLHGRGPPDSAVADQSLLAGRSPAGHRSRHMPPTAPRQAGSDALCTSFRFTRIWYTPQYDCHVYFKNS